MSSITGNGTIKSVTIVEPILFLILFHQTLESRSLLICLLISSGSSSFPNPSCDKNHLPNSFKLSPIVIERAINIAVSTARPTNEAAAAFLSSWLVPL